MGSGDLIPWPRGFSGGFMFALGTLIHAGPLLGPGEMLLWAPSSRAGATETLWGHPSASAGGSNAFFPVSIVWSQAAEEQCCVERNCKPMRLIFFFCHTDVKRTVIYFGISVILGILEIFAVSQGIVGIRGVFSNKFLAMSKKGKLHASARFTADCQFRERFQENSYNTYASAVHRSPRSGRQWYVALNKRGKAKRGCSPRARPQHVSTHFLPRFWQPQPPELAFTVTLPEKKPPPPPKLKVAPSPPRKNPGPVKYRLKFRFG
uniref:Fibroblast growth factor n=6 Tax=Neoaves TaxID=3078114 RepID=A0A663MS09_ATHCN